MIFAVRRRDRSHVAQDSRRDADARGHHGSAHEHRFGHRVPAPVHVGKTEDERSDDPGNRHQQRLAPHVDEILRADFEARVEQNKDGTNFGDGFQGVAGMDQSECIRA
jgi:hypothetical protein